MKVKIGGAFVLVSALIAAIVIPGGGGTCTGADVTTSTFASRVSSATAGDRLCLVTGSYGSFAGTNVAITIAAKSGESPTMTFAFGAGDSGFTLEGIGGLSGDINSSATGITIKNSDFQGNVTITGPGIDAIVLDNNTHNYDPTGDSGNAKINIESSGGTIVDPDVTVKNSSIENGDYDGIHIGGNNSSGTVIQGNYLNDICDLGANHADNIQWDDIDPGATQTLVKGNYVLANCPSQGITSFDAGTQTVTIEDNVCDLWTRGPCIEIYGDNNGGGGGSTVRHNTVVYHATAFEEGEEPCLGDGGSGCGMIETFVKPADVGGTNGTGTKIYDNIVTRVQVGSSSTVAQNGPNMCRVSSPCLGTGSIASATPTYVGGAHPTTYAGFCLAVGSTGENAASDGLDFGIRC